MLGASWSIMENMQQPCGFALKLKRYHSLLIAHFSVKWLLTVSAKYQANDNLKFVIIVTCNKKFDMRMTIKANKGYPIALRAWRLKVHRINQCATTQREYTIVIELCSS